MTPYDIILRPVITEKSTRINAETNVVTFSVHKDANKAQIREAVEQIFKVEVKAVRVTNVRGKKKRRGAIIGRTPSWRKAMITLAPGETIDVFEGV